MGATSGPPREQELQQPPAPAATRSPDELLQRIDAVHEETRNLLLDVSRRAATPDSRRDLEEGLAFTKDYTPLIIYPMIRKPPAALPEYQDALLEVYRLGLVTGGVMGALAFVMVPPS